MAVSVNTYALVTLDEAKNYLLEDPTVDIGTKEDLIVRLINNISTLAESYMSRKIKSRTYTNEEYDGNGTDTLQLLNYPISTLTSVYLDDDRNFAASSLIASTDLILYGDEGKIVRKGITIMIDEETGKILRSSCFTKGHKNIRVTYIAGYALVPDDIKHAVLNEIAWHYDKLVKKTLGIVGMSAIGENTTVFMGKLLPTTEMILSAYRRALR